MEDPCEELLKFTKKSRFNFPTIFHAFIRKNSNFNIMKKHKIFRLCFDHNV